MPRVYSAYSNEASATPAAVVRDEFDGAAATPLEQHVWQGQAWSLVDADPGSSISLNGSGEAVCSGITNLNAGAQ